MNATLEELEALTIEYQQRVAGRPLSDAERTGLLRVIARLDEVRGALASMLASPAEAMRVAMAGHDRGQAVGRGDH